jgi:hypothetical protein
MIKALLFTLLAVAIIMGGAMILLDTAKKPKIPPKLKSPEELDKEDEEWKN